MIKGAPSLAFRSVKIRGSVHNVPVPITEQSRVKTVVKWVLKLTKSNTKIPSSRSMAEVLSLTLINKGAV